MISGALNSGIVDEATLAAELAEQVLTILHNANTGSRGAITFVEDEVISDDRILTVAAYVMRDLARVNFDQDNSTSVAKLVGYIGFWFTKLKPLNSVWKIDDSCESSISREIQDINERVSLVLMDRILLRLISTISDDLTTVWAQCTNTSCEIIINGDSDSQISKRGSCYFKKNIQFRSKFEKRFGNYLVYTMRYRAASPYLMVNYIEQGLFFSCEAACPPLFQEKILAFP